MKKCLILWLIPLVMMSLWFSASAKETLLRDEADLLSDAEQAELESQLYAASARNSFDIAVILTDGVHDRAISDYGEEIYRSSGYGTDQVYGGALLVFNTGNEEWGFYTNLQGRYDVLTESDLEELEDLLRPYLEVREFYGAISQYTLFCDDRVTWNRLDPPREPVLPLEWQYIPIVLVGGAIAALIVVCKRASKLKTVWMQPDAVSYLREDSLRVTERSEHRLD